MLSSRLVLLPRNSSLLLRLSFSIGFEAILLSLQPCGLLLLELKHLLLPGLHLLSSLLSCQSLKLLPLAFNSLLLNSLRLSGCLPLFLRLSGLLLFRYSPLLFGFLSCLLDKHESLSFLFSCQLETLLLHPRGLSFFSLLLSLASGRLLGLFLSLQLLLLLLHSQHALYGGFFLPRLGLSLRLNFFRSFEPFGGGVLAVDLEARVYDLVQPLANERRSLLALLDLHDLLDALLGLGGGGTHAASLLLHVGD